MESQYIHKQRNVSVLMSREVDPVLREVCLEIAKRWEIWFLEIGVDRDHAHFLVQSVPMYSPSKIVQTVKSVTAREVFARVPEVKKKLWGGEFWGKGYFLNTVGQYGSERVIAEYVKRQAGSREYQQLHKGQIEFGF